MTRQQRLTPATIDLHREQHGQGIDIRDPLVAHWAAECGLISFPVAISLRARDEDALTQQIQRLNRTFGPLVHITMPRRDRHGSDWVAYGTFLA